MPARAPIVSNVVAVGQFPGWRRQRPESFEPPLLNRERDNQEGTDMKLKRMGLWAIGTGVLIGVGLVTAELGYADDTTKCTLATLKGQYLFTDQGTVVASAGYHIFNGDGTGTDFVTLTVNGVDQHVPSPVPISYTLKPDCTGTYTVQNGPNFDIFVAVDGSQLSVILTDKGAA